MATLFKPMDVQVDGDGVTLAGAKLYFYTTGTSTPQNTYSHADLDISHVNANPVLADADGLWPPIYLGATDYKAILKTAADATVQTLDPVLVNPAAASLSEDLDDQFGSTQYSLLQRGASAWQAVTFKAVLDNKFGTSTGTLIKRGSSDWQAWAMTVVTDALSADVPLDDDAVYIDGPSVTLDTDKSYVVWGSVTLDCKVAGSRFKVKLWDGTTVKASTIVTYEGSSTPTYKDVTLVGHFVNPPDDVRISVQTLDTELALILANGSGNSKDSAITALRVA